jgi:hypothetical protein
VFCRIIELTLNESPAISTIFSLINNFILFCFNKSIFNSLDNSLSLIIETDLAILDNCNAEEYASALFPTTTAFFCVVNGPSQLTQ